MKNRVGEYVRAEREKLRLGLGAAARLAGYRNAGKGARRIQLLEREGAAHKGLYERLIPVLGLDRDKLRELTEADRRDYLEEWEKWVNEPVPVQIVIRLLAAVYMGEMPPRQDWTREQWEAYAGEIAREKRMMVCLVVSRRHCSWLDVEGKVYARTESKPFGPPNPPFMQIRGRGAPFLFSGSSGGL